MFFVYTIQSKKSGSLYVGSTNNLKQRLKEHNTGKNRSTKSYMPWKLIYTEICLDQRDALRREKYLKTSQGARLLRARLKEYLYSSRS